MRMRVAASMLRHGRDPHQIAEETGVPLALLQLLIDEHLDNYPAASAPPPKPVHRHDKSRHNLDAHDATVPDPHPPASQPNCYPRSSPTPRQGIPGGEPAP